MLQTAGQRTRLAHRRPPCRAAGVGAIAACAARSRPSARASPGCGRVAPGPGADALLARLAGDGVLQRDGAHVLLVGAQADGRGSHAAEADAVLATLAAGGFTPPDLPAVRLASGLPDREFTALCAALERSERIVRFGGDLAYTSERFAERARSSSRAAPSTGRSRWPRCATTWARAAASRRACSSASTRTASRAGSAIAACCAGVPRRRRPAGPDRHPRFSRILPEWLCGIWTARG